MSDDKTMLRAPAGSKSWREGFFSDYPRFEVTSKVASDIERLNYRYAHIIERNRDILAGKRVLDIASHDARFTLAALVGGGASHVTGIEARGNLIAHAAENLKHYGITEDRFTLIEGDVFTRVHELPKGAIDTAMVLGFLYHTARQYELISAISALGARSIIVDSNVLAKAERPIILLQWEGTKHDAQIWDASRAKVLSSMPSAMALTMIMEEFGYEVEKLVPNGPLPPTAAQYRTGGRVTLVGRKRT